MERFKNILVVLDVRTENQALLDHATELCKRNRARLTLTTVLDDLSRSTGITTVWLEDLQEKLAEAQAANLHKLAAALRRQGVRVDVSVLIGTPFLQIIRAVLRHGYDLVMAPGGESGGGGTFFMGSTNMSLLRQCPCPVWIIKANQADGFTRILATVDPNPDNPVQEELNHQVLGLAMSLARLNKSQLHIVHVWSMAVESLLRWSNISLPNSEVDKMVDETREIHNTRLADLLSEYNFDRIDHQVHLLRGRPRKVIPELAAKQEIELIIMGTVARTGIAGLFIGNTAEGVLREVKCSVLALKPKGFITPVRLDGN